MKKNEKVIENEKGVRGKTDSITGKRRKKREFLLIYREKRVNIRAKGFEGGNGSFYGFGFCRWCGRRIHFRKEES